MTSRRIFLGSMGAGLLSPMLPSPSFARAAEKSAEPGKTVRIAGIVLKWVRADKEANYRRVEPMIRKAAAGGAKIVCTTECFLDGYAIVDKSLSLEQYRALGEEIPAGSYYKQLAALAAELKIHLIAGMVEADGKDRFNTAVLIGPAGKLVGKYRKQKIGHEDWRNSCGTTSSVFPTPYGPVGILICADRTFPEVVRGFRENGAKFLICASGGSWGVLDNDLVVQRRSRENKLPFVFVHPAEFLVTGPDGSVLERKLRGESLHVTREEVNGPRDKNDVFWFDLKVK